MNEEKLRVILLKYQQRRDESELLLENRKSEIYNKIPKIKLIDENISKIGLNMAKSVLENTSLKKEIVNKSKNDIKALTLQKEKLLKDNKVPSDYLTLKFNCELCQDRGFLPSGAKCNCLKQEIINEAYRMSNLNRVLSRENFENFNIDIFSTNKIDNSGVSVRENMLSIFTNCEKFTIDFDKDNEENLLFHGSTGLGKTYMCNCIAKRLLDKGYIVVYQTAFTILDILENYKFKKEDYNKINDENYKNLFECDLLIIDDLGTEINNSFTNSEFFNIINTRLNAGKKTIISTNLTPGQLGETYTQRILSRILGNFRMIKFIGSDLRWERNL